MKYYDQLIAHDPENGRYGDCFRTVLACMLDMRPEDFPHPFEDGYVDDDAGHTFINDFLATKGLAFVEVPFSGELTLEQILEHGAAYSKGNRYTLLGNSTTGVPHFVTCLGNQIDHNPNGAALVGPAFDTENEELKWWWVGWLVHKC